MSSRDPDLSSEHDFPPLPDIDTAVRDIVASLPGDTRVIEVAEGKIVTTPSRPDWPEGNMMWLRTPPSPNDGWTWRVETALAEHDVPFVQLGWRQPADTPTIDLGPLFETTSQDGVVLALAVSSAPESPAPAAPARPY